MFVNFFQELKSAGIPVTLREYLTLMEAMHKDLAGRRVEDSIISSGRPGQGRAQSRQVRPRFRPCLQRPGVLEDALTAEIPDEWLRRSWPKSTSPRRRKSRSRPWAGSTSCWKHCGSAWPSRKAGIKGGTKWIGTAGTSPFGAYGYNPEGIRIGQD